VLPAASIVHASIGALDAHLDVSPKIGCFRYINGFSTFSGAPLQVRQLRTLTESGRSGYDQYRSIHNLSLLVIHMKGKCVPEVAEADRPLAEDQEIPESGTHLTPRVLLLRQSRRLCQHLSIPVREGWTGKRHKPP
jgi:hypothetical protein